MGLRDYAMFLLIATYGLRASEVVAITLDDIRWRQGILRIHQRKTSSPLELPLTNEVLSALVKHLKRTPPPAPYRRVFLRMRAPMGVLKPTAVTEAFQALVRKSGLSIPYQGPHCMRHAYALRLLKNGTPLKTIGDILGHRTAESTSMYLRLATGDLREVALAVPGARDRKGGEVMKGTSAFTPVFSSRLAPAFARYVDLKRALGRRFDLPARTLQSLDRFLCDQSAKYSDLNAAAFQAWCHTHEHVTSGVRRVRMLEVRSFCLYRRRTEPKCFVPDPSFFPPYHQRLKPYIFSAAEVGKLLRAAAGLKRNPASPLRPELIRLAIVLLFTTGIRRGELLKLTLGDYDRQESTLHIRETKFYKSRLLPINGEIADEIERYLRVRARRRLPVSPDTALIWNATWGGRAYSGTGLRHCLQPLLEHCGIATAKGKPPTDPRPTAQLRCQCPAALVPSRRRCRGQAALAGDLPGSRFGRCRRIITCTSSNRSAPRPASGSRSITANWSLHCRNRQGGADENRASESTRRRNPRLLHRPPSPPSGNQSAHHPQLPRQHGSAAAVSFPTTEQADYGARPDGSRSSRNPRVPVPS